MRDRTRAAALALAAGLALAACGDTGPDAASSPPGTATPTETAAATSGDPVPETEIEAFSGETVTFAEYQGTPMVVNFWASWCPPCIAEMPDLEAVSQLGGDEVVFVGINTQDTPDRAAELVDETGATYDLLRDPDGELAREFGVFGMPSTFYVDADGTIVGRHTGLLTREALVADLHEHLRVDVDATAWSRHGSRWPSRQGSSRPSTRAGSRCSRHT